MKAMPKHYMRPYLYLIAAVSLLVPQRFRAEWKQEWEAELRHREALLRRWQKLDLRSRLELFKRSSGSFWDALWLQPQRLEEDMYQDVRYGVRMLLKKPGFTFVALMALALGIGANTAIFSVVHAVLLRQLPYEQPERIVTVSEKRPHRNINQLPLSWLDYKDFKEQNKVFEQLAAFSGLSVALSTGSETEQVAATSVTPNVFQVLGVNPLLGRTFLGGEDELGHDDVVVLSYGLWQRRFGSDQNIAGKTISLDSRARTVIGVMPSGFKFPLSSTSEVWLPLALTQREKEVRRFRFLAVLGRLKPGLTHAQAEADMQAVSQRMEQTYPADNTDIYAELIPLREAVVGDIRPSLLILFGAVGLVLLISCANVANLLLTRAMSRQKEIAIRIALGAGRLRLVRQLITESVLLGILGGGLGLLLAHLGVKLLVVGVPRALSESIPGWDSISLNPSVLVFTFIISILTGLVFGLMPALQASRPDLNQTLKEGGRTSGGGAGRQRIRSLLVVSELALALVLLAGAGLLIRSFQRLQQVDRGFNEAGLLTFQLSLPQAKYAEPSQQTAFYNRLLQGINSMPGVQSVGMVSDLPLAGGNTNWGLTIEGRPLPPSEDSRRTDYRVISPDYFRAMNIPLKDGRQFTGQDVADQPLVAVVNERLASLYFPGENPIGMRVHIGRVDNDFPWHTIVGVVGNVKHSGLGEGFDPELYYPVLQDPTPSTNVVVRAVGPPVSLAASVRHEVSAIDREEPISNVRTMEEVVSDSVASRRLNMVLLGIFAAVAAALAAVGIYGVMSYTVAQRTHEVGIRIALGARPSDILKLLVGHAALLAVIGAGIGLVGAFALTRLMSSLLYGISPTDPVTFAIITLVIILIALIASLIPARRALKVDPIVALRQE
jgi:putative ABC transport system permease protein